MTVLTDAGSKLPADFAGVAAMRAAPLTEAGEVTLDVVGLDVAESLSQTDAADGFSAVVAEQVAVGGSARTAVVLMNMVNIQMNTVGDDRFSPGVGGCGPLDRQDCVDMTCEEYRELLEEDSDSSEDCGCDPLGDSDCYDLRNDETEWERSSAEKAGDEWLAPVALSVGGDVVRQIVLPISELPEVHEDMAMIVLLPDSYDSDEVQRITLLGAALGWSLGDASCGYVLFS